MGLKSFFGENSANMIAFHFHALEIIQMSFQQVLINIIKISNELIEKIYKPYIKIYCYWRKI